MRHMATFGSRAFVIAAVLCMMAATMVWAADAPPLIQAVKAHDAGRVRALLAGPVEVDGAEVDGSTALHWAVRQDDPELVDLLLGAGADAGRATRYRVTPLAIAAANGSAPMIVRLLRAGVDPDSTSQDGETALMTAARNGTVEAIEVLVAHGADVNAREPRKGQTALMWAAGEGNAAAVAALVASGADVRATSASGFTPLLFAVLNDRVRSAEALLAGGADVNDVAPDGTSALNMAVVNAYYDLAAVLLDHGADPNAPDPRGSALHTLAWLRKPGATGAAAVGGVASGPPVPTGTMSALELAERLLDHGADPNIRVELEERRFNKDGAAVTNPPDIQLGRHLLSYNGATPFYVAANNGDVALMRLLAERGADPLIPTAFGVTPLMAAAGLNYYEGETPGPFTGTSEEERLAAVTLAFTLGNDLNARADFGDYPMLGDPAYTLLYYPLNIDDLVDLGVGDPRWDGSTALHGAVISGQPSIVQFLIDQGAEVDVANDLGWTPLMLARGVFLANDEKHYPEAEAIIRRALGARGLPVEDGR